jgi:hypothetical protein
MSFGKRGTGEGHPARNLLPPAPLTENGAPPATRAKVAKPGGIDTGFIALALGVVVISAGAALAAPSVLDMIGGGTIPVRPLEVVVAGLNRDEAKQALAREAFPDNEGRAFMSALSTKFPADHARLLDLLADDALKPGADRDDLVHAYSTWTMEFAPSNIAAIGRTGQDGFDEILGVASDALRTVETAAGGCTVAAFERFASSPEALSDLAAYGGEGYKTGMRAGRTLVELAAKGRTAGPVKAELTQDDMSALQTTFPSMMMDPQIVGAMSASGSGGRSTGFGANAISASDLDVCQLGRTLIVKLKKLPQPTKSRILALGTQNVDPAMLELMTQMSTMRPEDIAALQESGGSQMRMPSFPSGWQPPRR